MELLNAVRDGRPVTAGAREAFSLEEFKARHVTQPEQRRMLGLARIQMDGFLNSHGIYEDVTLEDVERDVADLKACLGGEGGLK
jgi:hypothetical protein